MPSKYLSASPEFSCLSLPNFTGAPRQAGGIPLPPYGTHWERTK